MALEIGNIGTLPTAFDPLNTFAIPADVPAPAAKKNETGITLADMPASFLATPETARPAAANETLVATVSPAAKEAEPIKVEFGNDGYSFATPTSTTPAAATGTTVVSDGARASAKGTLASIDAKLAQNGYSKSIGNQRDRTEAVNAVMKNMTADQKTKFLAELKGLAAPLGINLGQKALDGGKAQFDALGKEQQAINRELEQESKTGKSATPTAAAPAPAPVAKTATPTPPVTPPKEAAAKRVGTPTPDRPRGAKFNDYLAGVKQDGEAVTAQKAAMWLSDNNNRLTSSALVNGLGAPVAAEPEVGAIVKTNPTPQEFAAAMWKLANQQ